MDKIILALLFLKSRTVYEIREKLSGSLKLMYSSSTGSIQAAIKKLAALGLITFEETVKNGRYKKLYSITESGKRELEGWINSPFSQPKNKNPELAKLYFMGLSDNESRVGRIKEYINSLEKYNAALQVIYNDGLNLTPPAEYTELFKYQFITVKFGLDTSTYEINWLKKLVSDIERGKEGP